jgi:hypothetical protein
MPCCTLGFLESFAQDDSEFGALPEALGSLGSFRSLTIGYHSVLRVDDVGGSILIGFPVSSERLSLTGSLEPGSEDSGKSLAQAWERDSCHSCLHGWWITLV